MLESHIKRHHACMNQWTPVIGEILKTCLEPENAVGGFGVAVQKRRSNSWTSKQRKFRLFSKAYILFPTCKPRKYMSS